LTVIVTELKSRSPFRPGWARLVKLILTHLLLLAGCIIMAFPFIWMILGSLKTTGELFVFPPQWLPTVWHWENYLRVIQAMPFGWFTFNSFKIATLAAIGQILSCSLAAFAFARIKFPGREVVFFIWLACLMIPPQVLVIPLYVLYRQLGWLNTHLPLIVPNFFGGAFGTFLLRQFFMTIPTDLDDAAYIDGASRFQIYAHIYMPLAKPALATLAVFVFMTNWNDLLGPVIYLTEYKNMTLTVGLAFFRGQYATDWVLVLAGAVISIIPIMTLYALTQQYFVRGVILSGLKG
jgi:multiple sugar transport system permease protein